MDGRAAAVDFIEKMADGFKQVEVPDPNKLKSFIEGTVFGLLLKCSAWLFYLSWFLKIVSKGVLHILRRHNYGDILTPPSLPLCRHLFQRSLLTYQYS